LPILAKNHFKKGLGSVTSSKDKDRIVGMQKGLTKYGDDELPCFCVKVLSRAQAMEMKLSAARLLALSIQAAILIPVMAMPRN